MFRDQKQKPRNLISSLLLFFLAIIIIIIVPISTVRASTIQSRSPYKGLALPFDCDKSVNVSGDSKTHDRNDTKSYERHAVDFSVKKVNVLAMKSGTVARTGYDKSGGNFVLIDHKDGYYSAYLHLASYSVKKGDKVKQGQKIAVSGNTGNGVYHLHVSVSKYKNAYTTATNNEYPMYFVEMPSRELKVGDKLKSSNCVKVITSTPKQPTKAQPTQGTETPTTSPSSTTAPTSSSTPEIIDPSMNPIDTYTPTPTPGFSPTPELVEPSPTLTLVIPSSTPIIPTPTIPEPTLSTTFINGRSSIYFENNYDSLNVKVCADNLSGNKIYLLVSRPGKSWSYKITATDNCYIFKDTEGSGPALTNTTYQTRLAMNQSPDPDWPIPCAKVTNFKGLCDSIARP